MTLDEPPSRILYQLLVNASLLSLYETTEGETDRWKGSYSKRPETPDKVVTFYDVDSLPIDGRHMSGHTPLKHFVGMMVRGLTYSEAYAKRSELVRYMTESVVRATVGVQNHLYRVDNISLQNELNAGSDDKNRSLLTANFQVTIAQVTP